MKSLSRFVRDPIIYKTAVILYTMLVQSDERRVYYFRFESTLRNKNKHRHCSNPKFIEQNLASVDSAKNKKVKRKRNR